MLKGISDGLSRGKKPEEMENLVNCQESSVYFLVVVCLRYHHQVHLLHAGKDAVENSYEISTGI